MADRVTNPAGPQPVAGDFILPSPPLWMTRGLLILVAASWVPLVFIARARTTLSEKPRVHLIQDMDNQPKYKAQRASMVFADRRSMRPTIPGTVARGALDEDEHYNRGFTLVQNAEAGKWEARFFDGFPAQVVVDEAFIRRGHDRFNIYCTPCHGYDGNGNGAVSARAIELEEPKWVPPTALHTDTVRERTNGHLFNSITNGIRNMGGYAAQIPVGDRWAIVAYLRALQLSQHARIDDVPVEIRSTLR